MSTPQTTNGHVTDAPNFCENCGHPLPGGRFCPECGQALAPVGEEPQPIDEPETSEEAESAPTAEAPTEAFEPPTPPRTVAAAPAPAPAKRKRGPKPALLAGALAGLVLIAGAVAAIVLLTPSKGPGADTIYKQKVASAFGPVLGANRQVSDSLAHLRGVRVKGSHAANARLAVRRARQATTLATGAISTMSAPASSDQLARDTRQVLDRESAYLAAIASVLSDPANRPTAQIQTLGSDLTSALSAAGPTVAGTQPTVSGGDRLASWARAVRKHQQSVKAHHHHHTPTPTPTPGGGGGGSTTPTGTSCGGGVFAGPNTSCAFALNVRDAYNEAPGSSATVRVFSPVTNTTYTMSCAPSGNGITCSGANNASVTF